MCILILYDYHITYSKDITTSILSDWTTLSRLINKEWKTKITFSRVRTWLAKSCFCLCVCPSFWSLCDGGRVFSDPHPHPPLQSLCKWPFGLSSLWSAFSHTWCALGSESYPSSEEFSLFHSFCVSLSWVCCNQEFYNGRTEEASRQFCLSGGLVAAHSLITLYFYTHTNTHT